MGRESNTHRLIKKYCENNERLWIDGKEVKYEWLDTEYAYYENGHNNIADLRLFIPGKGICLSEIAVKHRIVDSQKLYSMDPETTIIFNFEKKPTNLTFEQIKS